MSSSKSLPPAHVQAEGPASAHPAKSVQEAPLAAPVEAQVHAPPRCGVTTGGNHPTTNVGNVDGDGNVDEKVEKLHVNTFSKFGEAERFMAKLKQFRADGTGYHPGLEKQFPLFAGPAPVGHPYPAAFANNDDGTDDGTDDDSTWKVVDEADCEAFIAELKKQFPLFTGRAAQQEAPLCSEQFKNECRTGLANRVFSKLFVDGVDDVDGKEERCVMISNAGFDILQRVKQDMTEEERQELMARLEQRLDHAIERLPCKPRTDDDMDDDTENAGKKRKATELAASSSASSDLDWLYTGLGTSRYTLLKNADGFQVKGAAVIIHNSEGRVQSYNTDRAPTKLKEGMVHNCPIKVDGIDVTKFVLGLDKLRENSAVHAAYTFKQIMLREGAANACLEKLLREELQAKCRPDIQPTFYLQRGDNKHVMPVWILSAEDLESDEEAVALHQRVTGLLTPRKIYFDETAVSSVVDTTDETLWGRDGKGLYLKTDYHEVAPPNWDSQRRCLRTLPGKCKRYWVPLDEVPRFLKDYALRVKETRRPEYTLKMWGDNVFLQPDIWNIVSTHIRSQINSRKRVKVAHDSWKYSQQSVDRARESLALAQQYLRSCVVNQSAAKVSFAVSLITALIEEHESGRRTEWIETRIDKLLTDRADLSLQSVRHECVDAMCHYGLIPSNPQAMSYYVNESPAGLLARELYKEEKRSGKKRTIQTYTDVCIACDKYFQKGAAPGDEDGYCASCVHTDLGF